MKQNRKKSHNKNYNRKYCARSHLIYPYHSLALLSPLPSSLPLLSSHSLSLLLPPLPSSRSHGLTPDDLLSMPSLPSLPSLPPLNLSPNESLRPYPYPSRSDPKRPPRRFLSKERPSSLPARPILVSIVGDR